MRAAIIACMLLAAASVRPQVDPSEVVGVWSRFEEFSGQQIVAILTIAGDGSYAMVAVAEDQEVPIELGTYVVDGSDFRITILQSLRAPQDVGNTITYTDATVEGDTFSYRNELGELVSWTRGTDPTIVTAAKSFSWGDIKARF